jgi:hypothetical protein
MKATITRIGIAVMGVGFLAALVYADDQLVLKTQKDKENYTTGVNIVRKLKQQGGEVNLDIMIQGMKDEITSEKLLMTEDDIQKTMYALQNEPKQSSPTPPSGKEQPGGQKTMQAMQDDLKKNQLKQKVGCAVIEFADHYESVCSDATQTPTSYQAHAQEPTPVQQQTAAALPAAQAQEQALVPVQTFAALAAVQEQQMNADQEIQIVRSDLSMMHGAYWLKAQPRQ